MPLFKKDLTVSPSCEDRSRYCKIKKKVLRNRSPNFRRKFWKENRDNRWAWNNLKYIMHAWNKNINLDSKKLWKNIWQNFRKAMIDTKKRWENRQNSQIFYKINSIMQKKIRNYWLKRSTDSLRHSHNRNRKYQ